ncbi:UNVERIFIED_CONTAM: hypothetical protein B566_EDAN018847 [Ephemera danica]|nr:hypothetical protein B566_EDAN018847 [Ephemera danica]
MKKIAEPNTYQWINGAPLTIPFFRNTNSLDCGLYSSSPSNQVGLTTLSCSAHKDYVCETERQPPCVIAP